MTQPPASPDSSPSVTEQLTAYLDALDKEANRLHENNCPFGWAWLWSTSRTRFSRKAVAPVQARKLPVPRPTERPATVPDSAVVVLEYRDAATPPGKHREALWTDARFLALEFAGPTRPQKSQRSPFDLLSVRLSGYKKEARRRVKTDSAPEVLTAAEILLSEIESLEGFILDRFGGIGPDGRPRNPEEVLADAIRTAERVGRRLEILRHIPGPEARRQNRVMLNSRGALEKHRGQTRSAWRIEIERALDAIPQEPNTPSPIKPAHVISWLTRNGIIVRTSDGSLEGKNPVYLPRKTRQAACQMIGDAMPCASTPPDATETH